MIGESDKKYDAFLNSFYFEIFLPWYMLLQLFILIMYCTYWIAKFHWNIWNIKVLKSIICLIVITWAYNLNEVWTVMIIDVFLRNTFKLMNTVMTCFHTVCSSGSHSTERYWGAQHKIIYICTYFKWLAGRIRLENELSGRVPERKQMFLILPVSLKVVFGVDIRI